MNPEVDALKQVIAAQAEVIAYMKWAIGGLCVALASESGFFVAWIRTLYAERLEEAAKQTESKDKLLERVLVAVDTLAQVVRLSRKGE